MVDLRPKAGSQRLDAYLPYTVTVNLW